jgi:hypothetical protein
MPAIAPNRIVGLLLLAASPALCQQPNPHSQFGVLPDAPSVQMASAQRLSSNLDLRDETTREYTTAAASRVQIFRAFRRAVSSPVTAPADTESGALQFGMADFDSGESADSKNSGKFFEKYLSRAAVRQSRRFQPEPDGSLMHRATYAASSILVQRDAAGNRHLNTSYLLSVLASTAADSASRPYWRRSAGQPFSDFGSTVGNDAGMNVFHQFQPALRNLVKTHQPRFITAIQSKIESRILGSRRP